MENLIVRTANEIANQSILEPPKYAVAELPKYSNESKMTIDEMREILNEFQDDPHFHIIPLPEFYMKENPRMWDEKHFGFSYEKYQQYCAINEKLLNAKSNQERKQILRNFVIKQMKKNKHLTKEILEERLKKCERIKSQSNI